MEEDRAKDRSIILSTTKSYNQPNPYLNNQNPGNFGQRPYNTFANNPYNNNKINGIEVRGGDGMSGDAIRGGMGRRMVGSSYKGGWERRSK